MNMHFNQHEHIDKTDLPKEISLKIPEVNTETFHINQEKDINDEFGKPIGEGTDNIRSNISFTLNDIEYKTDDNGKIYEVDHCYIPSETFKKDGKESKTDDNGKLYFEGNKYVPNITFIVDGHEYTTNDDGEIIENEEGLENEDPDVEDKDSIQEQVENTINTPDGLKALIERHPEKKELWRSQLEALETLNDPDASPAEIRSAQAKLSILKGQLMETAVKDALADAGFDVESQQRVVEGESGGTRPDVIAKNNTDHPIDVFGVTIQPGETLSVECKCGSSAYMTNQLNNHIPNQLSGQEGTKILLTTSDINDTPSGLAKDVCDRYDAKLIVVDVSVASVENAIKEVAES